jgi:hypothetical protein
MNHFALIQKFFTRMTCPHCGSAIHEHGVELVREMQGMFLVSVSCTECHQHVGMAMVGVDKDAHQQASPAALQRQGLLRRRYQDPELTPTERQRLAAFNPISFDDLLDVHEEVSSLGADWAKRIPPDILAKVKNSLADSVAQSTKSREISPTYAALLANAREQLPPLRQPNADS